MKTLFSIIVFLIGPSVFAQTAEERQLTEFSGRIFAWEVAGKMDSLSAALHEKFTLMSAAGDRATKAQYIGHLNGGSFVHNAISVQESTATIADNTGVVTGKGQFTITNNGQHSVLLLAYTEVFTRIDGFDPWLLLAIHANPLPPAPKQ